MNKNKISDGIVSGGGWNSDVDKTVEDLIDVKIYGYKVFILLSLISTSITGWLLYYLWICKIPYIFVFYSVIGLIYIPLQIYHVRMIIKRFGQKTRIVKEVGQRPVQSPESLY